MNAFNRIVMILLLILGLVVSLIVTLTPMSTLAFLIRFLETTRVGLEAMYNTNPLIFMVAQAGIAVAVVLVFGTLLALEVRRGRPAVVQVTTTEGGRANILLDSVAMRLAYHLDQLADVISVTPHVRGKGNVVHVDLDVETSPDVDVPMKTQEILHVTREVIEERMGLQLGRVDVRIRHAPYPKETGDPTLIGSAQQ